MTDSWRRFAPLLLGLTIACGDDDASDDTTTGATTGGTTTMPATGETSAASSGMPDDSTGSTPGTTTDAASTSTGAGSGSTTGAGAFCGNGVMEDDEPCDDGNEIDADGCNTDCTISGSVLWSHTQPSGTGQDDDAYDVAVDGRGNAYVVGEFFGFDRDFWVRQYTADGGLGWTQSIHGGTANDGARGAVIAGDLLYVTGYTTAVGQSNNVWLRGFGLDGASGLNVTFNDAFNGADVGRGIAADPGGNVVVAGDSFSNLQGQNVWVREYTGAGGLSWTASYNGPLNALDRASAVATDAMGNVAVAGFHTVMGQGRDLWLRVYDTAGNAQWTATYTGPNGLDEEATAVAFDAAGNVIVAGFEVDPGIPWRMILRKYDPSGMELWSQPWDGELGEGARADAIAVDLAGDIVVVGQQRDAGYSDILVRKYDDSGTARWTTTIAGFPMTHQVGRGVTIDDDNRIWAVGGLDLGVDGRDVFVARLAP